MPSATRPQRPARWLADACDTSSMGRRCTLRRWLNREMRANPGSTTYRMPGTVMRGLGHVGGQHDAAAGVVLEDPLLLGGGQPGVERQHLGVGQVEGPQGVGGVADLALAGEEHEHVAGAGPAQLLHRVGDAGDLVAALLVEGPVPHLDREGAAADLDDRRAAEVLGEALGLDGGRGDDDLEVGALRQQLGEVAEDEVDVEAALVGLVDDDRVVGPQHAVALELVEQDAVGHQLHEGAVADLVGEAHGVADGLADLDVELLGDAAGHRAGRQPPGLGVADHPLDAAPELEADLGDLGGLPRAGLAGDDHDLVVADGVADLLAALRDRELLGVGDAGHRLPASLDELGRRSAGHRATQDTEAPTTPLNWLWICTPERADPQPVRDAGDREAPGQSRSAAAGWRRACMSSCRTRIWSW